MTVTLSPVWRSGPDSISTWAGCTVNWSATLGSATSLGSGSNRTLYIYRSDGYLLGSGMIKNGVSWGSSQTYSGSFNISFDAGTYDPFTWNVYIQTSSEGTQSCIWTNRSYCTDFAVSWPLYWSYASAPTTLSFSPNLYESTVRLSWSGAGSGIYNGISTYHCYYQYSDDGGASWSGENGVDSQGAGYIDLNTSGWPRGRLLRFHVYSIAPYNTPLSGWSGNAQKNRAPNAPAGTPGTDKSIYSPGDVITLAFTPNGTPDSDGNLSGYEAAMQNDAGQWYGAGPTIIGSKGSTGAPYTITISTVGWTAGMQWKLFVRGYDALGVRGNWSNASALILIGLPFKANIDSVWKNIAEAKVLIDGVWKQVTEIKVLVNGAWCNLVV